MFACLAVFRDRGFSGFLICSTCSERLLSCHSAENIPIMQQEVSITNCWHPNSAQHKWMCRMPAAPQLRTRPSWSRGIGTAEGNEQKMGQVGQVTLENNSFWTAVHKQIFPLFSTVQWPEQKFFVGQLDVLLLHAEALRLTSGLHSNLLEQGVIRSFLSYLKHRLK